MKCARLQEAGYADPWSMTPREIVWRVQVYNRIHAENRIEDVNIGILASRAEKKDVEDFVRKASTVAEARPDNPTEQRKRRASGDEAKATAAAVAQAESVWKKRD